MNTGQTRAKLGAVGKTQSALNVTSKVEMEAARLMSATVMESPAAQAYDPK